MDKNIKAYVNDGYKSFLLSDLIFRILGVFIYNYTLVFFVLILSPFGYDSGSFFSNAVFPYKVALSINSIILSVIFIYVYARQSKSGIIFSRAITAGYISITLLIVSLLNCYGNFIYFQDILSVTIKVFFFLAGMFIYPFFIKKKIIPNFIIKHNCDNSRYIFLAPSLVLGFKRMLASFGHVNAFDVLIPVYYMMSMALAYYSIEFFIKAYYAKKYLL